MRPGAGWPACGGTTRGHGLMADERGSDEGFSDAERAAMQQRKAELREQAKGGKGAAKKEREAQACLDAIAALDGTDRTVAERLHAIVTEEAPQLDTEDLVRLPVLRPRRQGRRLLPAGVEVRHPLRHGRLQRGRPPRRRRPSGRPPTPSSRSTTRSSGSSATWSAAPPADATRQERTPSERRQGREPAGAWTTERAADARRRQRHWPARLRARPEGPSGRRTTGREEEVTAGCWCGPRGRRRRRRGWRWRARNGSSAA